MGSFAERKSGLRKRKQLSHAREQSNNKSPKNAQKISHVRSLVTIFTSHCDFHRQGYEIGGRHKNRFVKSSVTVLESNVKREVESVPPSTVDPSSPHGISCSMLAPESASTHCERYLRGDG